MDKLPVLISIPHGGTQTPKEVSERVCLSNKELFEDGDAFTREIYGIENQVLALVKADIARAFVDLNRETTDRPPENPDGIVKTKTCHNQDVYSPDLFPSDVVIETLIQKYYYPYHKKIQDLLITPTDLVLALDCHTMEPVGPSISPDRDQKRPPICLGNVHGKSCPDAWVQTLAECFQESFNLKENEVTLNEPFAGGYITRKYGNAPIPWIQIELNRNLYLADPWFDKNKRSIVLHRLQALREQFLKGLTFFFNKITL